MMGVSEVYSKISLILDANFHDFIHNIDLEQSDEYHNINIWKLLILTSVLQIGRKLTV